MQCKKAPGRRAVRHTDVARQPGAVARRKDENGRWGSPSFRSLQRLALGPHHAFGPFGALRPVVGKPLQGALECSGGHVGAAIGYPLQRRAALQNDR